VVTGKASVLKRAIFAALGTKRMMETGVVIDGFIAMPTLT
jgi:hypothetical protein